MNDIIVESVKTDRICELCGSRRNLNPKIYIIIHHKDRNRNNNDISNLQKLCASCHAKVHARRFGIGIREMGSNGKLRLKEAIKKVVRKQLSAGNHAILFSDAEYNLVCVCELYCITKTDKKKIFICDIYKDYSWAVIAYNKLRFGVL